ncbi:MAG TPA: hypothetical protein P5250_08625, partial [Bacteroidales bacterium]|nr:hypothetical protein [Bacteroidales bacterium]
TFKFADSIWKHSSNYQYDTNFQVISPKNKVYTSYEQPYFINDTTFCAIKYGLQHEKHFVIISGKNEKKLYTPGYFNPIRLATSGETIIFSNNKKYEELIYSTNGKYITWSEVQYDKRWAHQTWSIIKKYDIDKGKIQKLTKYTKYFAPAISPNGQLIAVSEILPEYKFSLVIIDAYKGNEIKRLSLPHNEMLITPSWSPDNKQLYCIAMDKDGNKGILKINYDDLKYEYILNPSHNEISRPLFDGKFIFFNGSYDGISNIYALNPENYKIYRVSSAKYGALYPSVLTEKNKIAFSNYTNNGYQIVVVPYDTSKWSEINYENISYLPIAETITNQELNLINNNNKIDTNYTIKKYSKLLHLFHFHSWMPFYYGDVNEIYPGITLMSQNILSTAFLVLNYGYNYNEKKSVINSSFIYKGFYPIIKIKQSYGGRKSYFSDYNTINQIEFNWNEAITSLNINIPLNLTKSKWFRSFTPYTEIQNIYITDAKHNAPFNGSLQALSVGFIYRNLLKTAERDLRPRWGQMIDFNYISSLNANLKSK